MHHAMNIQNQHYSRQLTEHVLDHELARLNQLLLDMTDVLIYQIEQTLLALDYYDMDLALKVIARDRKINHYQTQINSAAMIALNEYCQAESDFCKVISSNKIACELEKVGNEWVEFARLITVLFELNPGNPKPKLQADIFKLSSSLNVMLGKVMDVLEIRHSQQAYSLLHGSQQFIAELQKNQQQQLELISHNPAEMSIFICTVQIMETIKRCGEHCKNIAEYQIYMLDGLDVRHTAIDALVQHAAVSV